MSIDRTDYIVYGWRLPSNPKNPKNEVFNVFDEKFLPMIEGHWNEPFRIYYDFSQRSGYTVFGIKLKMADNGWQFAELNFDKNSFDVEKLKNKYKELFFVDGELTDPHIFIFSHYV